MKNFFCILLLFFLCFSFVEAKGKVRGGGAVFMHGIKTITTTDYRSYKDISENYCQSIDFTNTDSYLCDSEDEINLNMLNSQIVTFENEIKSVYVNDYDAESVSNYNQKIDGFNKLIENYNSSLDKQCIQLREYCMPQSCQERYPGTVYKKSEDKCVCSSGKDYNEVIGQKGGNGCEDIITNTVLVNTKVNKIIDGLSILLIIITSIYILNLIFKRTKK